MRYYEGIMVSFINLWSWLFLGVSGKSIFFVANHSKTIKEGLNESGPLAIVINGVISPQKICLIDG